MEQIIVRGAPGNYCCHEGALQLLEENLLKRQVKRILLISGRRSWNAAKPYFPRLSSIDVIHEFYQGECSEEEIKRLQKRSLLENVQMIVAVGGGKVLDLGKAVANQCQVAVALIPTLPSTCAAWTPLSVIYEETGSFVAYTIFSRSNDLVLIEPKILVDAPLIYLRAGIGDTLAKWYEARALTKELSSLTIPIEITLQTAKLCKDILLSFGEKALRDANAHFLSSEVIKVIETIILAGGMVGGFGDHFGRIAAAHSVHNGLTTLSQTHHLLHGEKVAYGILIQLALEGEWQEISALISNYQKLGLPYKLEHLHLSIGQQCELKKIAEATVKKGESIHFMPDVYDDKNVLEAIIRLETFVEKYQVSLEFV